MTKAFIQKDAAEVAAVAASYIDYHNAMVEKERPALKKLEDKYEEVDRKEKLDEAVAQAKAEGERDAIAKEIELEETRARPDQERLKRLRADHEKSERRVLYPHGLLHCPSWVFSGLDRRFEKDAIAPFTRGGGAAARKADCDRLLTLCDESPDGKVYIGDELFWLFAENWAVKIKIIDKEKTDGESAEATTQ